MSPENESECHNDKSRESGSCPMREMFDFVFNLPGEEMEHFRQSKIEFWRGVKSLIDRRIDSLEKAGRKDAPRARKVKVE